MAVRSGLTRTVATAASAGYLAREIESSHCCVPSPISACDREFAENLSSLNCSRSCHYSVAETEASNWADIN